MQLRSAEHVASASMSSSSVAGLAACMPSTSSARWASTSWRSRRAATSAGYGTGIAIPGARVDLPSIDYSFAFSPEIEQEWTWSEQFAAQPELLAYINFVADRLDLRKHFQFNTRVTSALWDETRKLWKVTTDRGDAVEATYCIMATGPAFDSEGPARFPGSSGSRARSCAPPSGRTSLSSFTGKRVGVIGTGSTGIQIVQEVGPQAGELFVFQRTPSFTMPMRNQKLEPDYVAEVKRNYAGIREAARNSAVGGVRPQSTRAFFSVTPAQRSELLEDSWKQGGLAMLGTFSDLMTNAEANEHVAEFVRGKIDEVVKDPDHRREIEAQRLSDFRAAPVPGQQLLRNVQSAERSPGGLPYRSYHGDH